MTSHYPGAVFEFIAHKHSSVLSMGFREAASYLANFYCDRDAACEQHKVNNCEAAFAHDQAQQEVALVNVIIHAGNEMKEPQYGV